MCIKKTKYSIKPIPWTGQGPKIDNFLRRPPPQLTYRNHPLQWYKKSLNTMLTKETVLQPKVTSL